MRSVCSVSYCVTIDRITILSVAQHCLFVRKFMLPATINRVECQISFCEFSQVGISRQLCVNVPLDIFQWDRSYYTGEEEHEAN